MANRNINEIFNTNPLASMPSHGLLYVGIEGVDAAIQASSIFPTSSVDNSIVRWNGSGGNKFQGCDVIIDDNNNMSGIAALFCDAFKIGDDIVNLGGALTTGGAFTTSGAYSLSLNLSGATSLTLPTSGIVATTNATIPSIAGSSQILVNGGTAPVTGVAVTLSLANWAGFNVTVLTGGSAALQVNRGYVSNYTGGLQFLSLPSTSAVGDIIMLTGLSAGRWIITLNSGQVIHVDSRTTTPGPVGQISSTAQYDSVFLMCTVANTEFNVMSYTGTLTVG